MASGLAQKVLSLTPSSSKQMTSWYVVDILLQFFAYPRNSPYTPSQLERVFSLKPLTASWVSAKGSSNYIVAIYIPYPFFA